MLKGYAVNYPSNKYQMNMKIEIELIAPTYPSTLTLKLPSKPGMRQDGFKHGTIIPISSLSWEQAKEYAEMLEEGFLEHWKKECEKPL